MHQKLNVADAAPVANGRLDFLDALRFVAAGLVLVQHTFELALAPGVRAVVDFSPGVLGVALFFLISGFVMPMSVRGDAFDLRDFAVRRLFRIYPCLLFAFALSVVAALTLGINAGILHFSRFEWVANILLVQDLVGAPSVLNVTWTLLLEVAWYAIFALAWRWRGRRAVGTLFWAMTAGLVVIDIASLAIGRRVPLGRIGMIYAAAFGAQAWRWHARDLSDRGFAVVAATFFVIICIGNAIAFGHFHHPKISFLQAFVPWVIAPVIFVGVIAAFRAVPSLAPPRALGWLGAISYSIYLLHPVVMELFHGRVGDWAFIGLTCAGSIVVARAAFVWVEKPGIAMGRRVAKALAGRAA